MAKSEKWQKLIMRKYKSGDRTTNGLKASPKAQQTGQLPRRAKFGSKTDKVSAIKLAMSDQDAEGKGNKAKRRMKSMKNESVYHQIARILIEARSYAGKIKK